jgi:hypothetical protein
MKPNFSISISFPAAIIAMMLCTACTKKFDAINTDKTQIKGVSDKELAGLFTNAQINGVCWLTGDQYGRATRYWGNLLSGYFVTNSFSSEQLVINYDHISAVQDVFFSKAMPAMVAIQQNAAENNPAAYHMATIWKAYVMYQLVDVWGPLPYKEAGTGKSSIPYESVQDVYNDIFTDLKAAVDYLTDQLQKSPGLNIFGAGDIIYNGDVSKWIKFANTMRLRLAMRIANIDADKAKAEAESAAQGPVMDSNDDNAWIVNLASFNGTENGMVRNKTSMLMSANMESFLKGYNDPRLPIYFSPVPAVTIAGAPPQIAANVGTYQGMMPGYSASDGTYIKLYSPPGPQWFASDVVSTNTPIPIKFAAETMFLKAEGAWRGWNMGGDAQDLYEKGIRLSLQQWLPSITGDAIDAYLNGETPPSDPDCYPYTDLALTDVPVKFSADHDKQFEQIITQKWLALYPDAWEAWAEYRRTRLPKLYQRKATLNPDIDLTQGQILTRMIYPEDEKIAQPDEVKKAIQLLGGPDKYSTPLWWDVHSN